MDIQLLLQLMRHQRLIVDFVYIASAMILIYDHLLTLEMEISLVWSSNCSYTKVMFLAARYLPIPGIFILLYNQLYLGASQSICSWSFHVATWTVMISVLCAECIFMVRTWAVWNRNRTLGIVLAALACTVFVVEGYSITSFSNSVVVLPPPFPGWRGCFVTQTSTIIYIALYWLAFVDAIVLAMMAISAFQAFKFSDNLKLSNIIHRDGILFYLYILCLVFASATIILLAPPTLMNLLYPVPVVLYSSFSARVILNIRSVAQEPDPMADPNDETELHTMYDEPGHIRSMPLTFRHYSVFGEDLDEAESSDQPAFTYVKVNRCETRQRCSA